MLPQFDPTAMTQSADVIRHAGLSDDAAACTDATANLCTNLERLRAAGLGGDAIRMIAQALPKPYAVAWAIDCLGDDVGASDSARRDPEALQLARQWLQDPSETNRAAAFAFAESSHYATAGAWLAAAAGLSGGSLAPEGYAVVPPPDAATGHAVHAALLLAAAAGGGDVEGQLGQFIDRAVQTFGSAESRPTEGAS